MIPELFIQSALRENLWAKMGYLINKPHITGL